MAITKATTGSNTIYDDNLLLSTTHTLDLICPIGTILMWPKSTPPKGWLICNGGTFNQTTYPKLYEVLGNSTRLPNFQGRVPVGVGSVTENGTFSPTLKGTGGEVKHTLTVSEMPAHRHYYTDDSNAYDWAGSVSNTYDIVRKKLVSGISGEDDGGGAVFLTSRNVDTNGNVPATYETVSHNNIQPYYGIYFIIKAEHAIMN